MQYRNLCEYLTCRDTTFFGRGWMAAVTLFTKGYLTAFLPRLPLGADNAFVYGWSREFCLGLNLNSVENLTPFRLI